MLYNMVENRPLIVSELKVLINLTKVLEKSLFLVGPDVWEPCYTGMIVSFISKSILNLCIAMIICVIHFYPLAFQAEGVLSLPPSVRPSVNFTLSAP